MLGFFRRIGEAWAVLASVIAPVGQTVAATPRGRSTATEVAIEQPGRDRSAVIGSDDSGGSDLPTVLFPLLTH
jgi:hypothetical protein